MKTIRLLSVVIILIVLPITTQADSLSDLNKLSNSLSRIAKINEFNRALNNKPDNKPHYQFIEIGFSKRNDNIASSVFNVKVYEQVIGKLGFIAELSKIKLKSEGAVSGNISEIEMGFSYHAPISKKIKIVGSVSGILASLELKKGRQSGTESESGYGLGLGIRHQVTDNIEATFDAKYKNIHDVDFFTGTSVSVGGRYVFNDAISAGVSLSTSLDKNKPEIITSSLRWSTL